MFKDELLAVLKSIEPQRSLYELRKPELVGLCVERLSIREIEQHLFKALHARRQTTSNAAAVLSAAPLEA